MRRMERMKLMSVRINTKALGLKKPIFIEQSVRNVKLANEMMDKMLKLGIEQEKVAAINFDELEEKETTEKMLEINTLEASYIDDAFVFLQNILKLSSKEKELAESTLTMEKLGEYLNYVVMRVKGIEGKPEAISEKDPKKRLRLLSDEYYKNKDEQADLLFLQKTLLLESGIPVSVSDKEDFQLLVEVINAKAKEDREVSPREMLRRFRGQ